MKLQEHEYAEAERKRREDAIWNSALEAVLHEIGALFQPFSTEHWNQWNQWNSALREAVKATDELKRKANVK